MNYSKYSNNTEFKKVKNEYSWHSISKKHERLYCELS